MPCNMFVLALAAVLACGCRAADGPPGPRATAPAPPSAAAARDASFGEPTGVVTLQEALARALARHPQLAVFPYELRAADARLLQAGLLPNPELGVEIEEFGGAGARRSFEGAETTVQFNQPIQLAGKRDKRKRLASFDKELVQWDYRSVRLDVLREATRAFAAVLAAQERFALSARLLELSLQAQGAVAQRVQAGKDSPVDGLKAEVALAESRIERQKAREALTAARQNLAAAWGGRTPAFEKVAGDFYAVAEPRPLTEVTAALAENPDVARWQTEEDKRRAALHLEKARAVPDLTVGGGVRRFEETDDAALVVGLGVPLPVFDRNQGGIREAVANLAKTRRQYEAVQVRTLAALTEATSALAAAHAEVTTLRSDILPKAEQAFEAAQQGYRQGKFDYLYVLDAQRTFFQTQAQYVDSLEAYHKARADIDRLTGRPAEATPQSPGQEDHYEK